MATQTTTPNLNLPQYTREDIFDLTDINESYLKIDLQYKELKEIKETVESTNPSGALQGQINTINSSLETIANKPIISFIFDDNDIGNINLFNIFKEYGFVFTTANIVNYSLINSTAKVPFTRLIQEKDNGFDTISHSMEHSVLDTWGNMNLSNATYEIEQSANWLRDWGFNSNGYVASNNVMNEIFMPYIKNSYDYAFTGQPEGGYVVNTYKSIRKNNDIYKLYRWNIDEHNGSVETVKQIIDKTIEQNGYTCLFGHKLVSSLTGSYMFTENHIRGILSYLREKVDAGEVVCLSTNNAISNYFGISLKKHFNNYMTENLLEKTSSLEVVKLIGNTPIKTILNDDKINITINSNSNENQRFLLQTYLNTIEYSEFKKILYSSFEVNSTTDIKMGLKLRLYDLDGTTILDTIETTKSIGNKTVLLENKISLDKKTTTGEYGKVLLYLDIEIPINTSATITIANGMFGYGVKPIKRFLPFLNLASNPSDTVDVNKGVTPTTGSSYSNYYSKMATITIPNDLSSVSFRFTIQENANTNNRLSCGELIGFVRKNGTSQNVKIISDSTKILSTDMNFHIVVVQNDTTLVAEIYSQCKLTYQYCIYNLINSYGDKQGNVINIENNSTLIQNLPVGTVVSLF